MQKTNLQVDICVKDKRWYRLKNQMETATKKVLDNKNAYIGLFLTDVEEIQELNKEYRNKDKPTNVLSISCYDKINDIEILGDVYLCYDIIKSEAKYFKLPMEEHAIHLLVHGIMHLLGYDHETESDWKKMKEAEIENFKKLGIRNLYENDR